MVFRHDFEEVPPRVEDEISEAGIELLVRRVPLWPWIVENAGRCRAARRDFDRQRCERESWPAV